MGDPWFRTTTDRWGTGYRPANARGWAAMAGFVVIATLGLHFLPALAVGSAWVGPVQGIWLLVTGLGYMWFVERHSHPA